MKPNTYTQLYIHIVFAVKYRKSLLSKKHRSFVYPYISGVLNRLGHKPILTNGMPDHIHILFGLNPKTSISETVREIKRSSSLMINKLNWFPTKFSWQEGYGAFSYSQSHLKNIYKYIENQETHHKQTNFKNEYISFLKKFDIEYDEKYLFNSIDD